MAAQHHTMPLSPPLIGLYGISPRNPGNLRQDLLPDAAHDALDGAICAKPAHARYIRAIIKSSANRNVIDTPFKVSAQDS